MWDLCGLFMSIVKYSTTILQTLAPLYTGLAGPKFFYVSSTSKGGTASKSYYSTGFLKPPYPKHTVPGQGYHQPHCVLHWRFPKTTEDLLWGSGF